MGNKFREKVVEEGLEEPKRQPVAPVESAKEEAVTSEDVQAEAAAPAPKAGKGRGAKAARGLASVLGGDILADKLVLKQIPLLLLCLFYLLLIIGNRYRIENLSRELQASEERINYLREQRIQMQKQYQQSVKISQIAEDLKETGVGITAGPPYEI